MELEQNRGARKSCKSEISGDGARRNSCLSSEDRVTSTSRKLYRDRTLNSAPNGNKSSKWFLKSGDRAILSSGDELLCPNTGAKHCEECVCLSVREPLVRELTTFSMRVTYGRGSVILCRRCDVSYISSFVDDVMFLILGPCRHAASVAATPLRSW